MPSPFPGMDPYLEPHWLDVHTALVSEARRALNRVLPPGLVARVEERVAIESDDQAVRRIAHNRDVSSRSTAFVVELDPIVERFIRIIDEAGELITVIEFISPTNKRQPGLDDYRQKRAALLAAGVHMVEVDLVRAGNWRALMRPEVCPGEAISPYRVTIRTSGAHPAGYLFPIRLREPLPVVPIPLRPSDNPLTLALQPLLASVYDDGRYDQTVDYHLPLQEPLDDDDDQWADCLLRTTGRR